ncbi:MAG: hypothetical protein HONDAALG_01943 [Gammaproteobacteria bacterium]|nr:hypothetical protein [Gammaproteobacteria bacterium]
MGPEISEHHFTCPYCGETVSVLLDLSVDGTQDYVEDCEVCCRPMRLALSAEDGLLAGFEATQSD